MEINPLKKWDIPHKYVKLKEKFSKRMKSSNFETTYLENFLYERLYETGSISYLPWCSALRRKWHAFGIFCLRGSTLIDWTSSFSVRI